MTTAREEAQRRWPGAAFETVGHDGRPIGPGAELRFGFVQGAAWQAKQPVEITDEMIERAARAWVKSGGGFWSKIPEATRRRAAVRFCAVLEAALGGEA